MAPARMLPYATQVAELEKVAELEPERAFSKRDRPALSAPQHGDGVRCLVCSRTPAGWCESCKTVYYCGQEHHEADARWHDAVCDRLREVVQDCEFRAQDPAPELAGRLLGHGGVRERGLLAGWDAYLGRAAFGEPVERRVLTDLASRPLTIARLLDDLKVPNDAGAAIVRVHVMGASAKELEATALYGELGSFWPETSFEIAFVGPELSLTTLDHPERIRFTLHACPYRRDLWSEVGRPDLIVAFDAGLLVYRSWRATLLELFGSGVPFAITSYRSWEANAEAELLGGVGATCLRRPARNPFGSEAWRRSGTVANDVSQDNSYLSVWR